MVLSKPLSQHDHVYEDFEPTTDWLETAEYDTLLIYLPGFKRDQLKVQVTSAKNLRIMGERPLQDNIKSRFHIEMKVTEQYDTNQITGKFEHGMLQIKHPKITSKAKPQQVSANTPTENARLQELANESQDQKGVREKTNKEVPQQAKIMQQRNPVTNEAIDAIAGQGKTLKQEIKEHSDVNQNNTSSTVDNNSVEQQKSLDDQKSQYVAQARKNIDTSEKHENRSECKHGTDMTGKNTTEIGNFKSKLVYDKLVIGGLFSETKKRIKLANLLLTGLLVLALGMYVRNSVRSREESEN